MPADNSSSEISDDENEPIKLPDFEDEDAIDEDFDDEFGEFNDDLSDIVINEEQPKKWTAALNF